MITINYGSGNSASKSVAEFPTIGHILSNHGLASFLQFPVGAVSATVNGRTVDNDYALRAGDAVELITRSNTKG
jgi:hypothetical protein